MTTTTTIDDVDYITTALRERESENQLSRLKLRAIQYNHNNAPTILLL